MSKKLREEDEWVIVERYQLSRMFTAKAREITDEFISEKVGIPVSDVQTIKRGRMRKDLIPHKPKVLEWIAKRDQNKSHAANHSEKILMKEFDLSSDELKGILRSRR